MEAILFAFFLITGCDAILPAPLVFVSMIFAVFEGFLFSLFTCIMFCTQVHAIITDETVSLTGLPLFPIVNVPSDKKQAFLQ